MKNNNSTKKNEFLRTMQDDGFRKDVKKGAKFVLKAYIIWLVVGLLLFALAAVAMVNFFNNRSEEMREQYNSEVQKIDERRNENIEQMNEEYNKNVEQMKKMTENM